MVFGRATDTTQIIGISLIETTTINSVVAIKNPSGNSTALTVVPLSGGTKSNVCNIIIKQFFYVISHKKIKYYFLLNIFV